MKHPEIIAVMGGTGKAGRYLIHQLLKQGYAVKALARHPPKIGQTGPGIEIVEGNARNYDSIHKLLTGCDAVISTLGGSGKEPDTCSIAIGHVLKSMEELDIQRYIDVAGLAIDTPGDRKGFQTRAIVTVLRWFASAVINDRQKGYILLKNSSIRWTIVRCPMIRLTDATGVVKASLTDCPGRKISSTDLALFLIGQLTDEKYICQAPFLAN